MDHDWNGFVDLLANLIAKYAGVVDLDKLPNPMPVSNENENNKMGIVKHILRTNDKNSIIYMKILSKLIWM